MCLFLNLPKIPLLLFVARTQMILMNQLMKMNMITTMMKMRRMAASNMENCLVMCSFEVMILCM